MRDNAPDSTFPISSANYIALCCAGASEVTNYEAKFAYCFKKLYVALVNRRSLKNPNNQSCPANTPSAHGPRFLTFWSGLRLKSAESDFWQIKVYTELISANCTIFLTQPRMGQLMSRTYSLAVFSNSCAPSPSQTPQSRAWRLLLSRTANSHRLSYKILKLIF